MSHSSTTLVSGFIDLYKYDNVKRNESRSISTYLENAKHFISLPYPKVIFLEQDVLDIVKDFPYDSENTVFIQFEKEELDLWPQRDLILQTCQRPACITKDKDTHDYMMLIIHKTSWMAKAVHLNPFKSTQFVWADFGLYHVVKNPENFRKGFDSMMNTPLDKIRVAGCWPPNDRTNYSDRWILWYFSGGVFGGSSEVLLRFHSLVQEEVQKLISRGKITWEVNIWYEVYLQHPEMFSWYYAVHDVSMLNNFSKIVEEMKFVLHKDHRGLVMSYEEVKDV